MAIRLDVPVGPAVTRDRLRARPDATIPDDLADRLRTLDDPAEQLALIASRTLPELVRKIAWQVGHAKAEDLAMDVVERHLAAHTRRPRASYRRVEAYHRVRASLIRSIVNAAIDHLRHTSTRVEVPVGAFVDRATGDVGGWDEADAHHDADERPALRLDAAALYDGLRRLEGRDAILLRMKLDGATFADLAEHLGVRSTAAAYKQYQRAARAAQALLRRYHDGGFCAEYGPYLLLLRQEVAAAGEGAERPLTAAVGAARAGEIRMHVYGDDAVASDEGCDACCRAAREHEVILSTFLPPLMLPAGGLFGWLASLVGGGASAGSGVVATGAALVAAAALTVGGAMTVRSATHDEPPRPAARIVSAPSAPPSPASARASAARPPFPSPARAARATGSAAQEFAPAARPSRPAPRAAPIRRATARPSPTGSAVREFSPGP